MQFSQPVRGIDIVLYGAEGAQDHGAGGPEASLRVGVARASTQDTAITAVAPQGTRIMRFDDDATTAQALLSGQVDAIGVNTIIGRADRQAMNPSANYEPKFVLRQQPNGIAVRRGQSRSAPVDQHVRRRRSRPTASSTRSTGSGSNAPLPELPVLLIAPWTHR